MGAALIILALTAGCSNGSSGSTNPSAPTTPSTNTTGSTPSSTSTSPGTAPSPSASTAPSTTPQPATTPPATTPPHMVSPLRKGPIVNSAANEATGKVDTIDLASPNVKLPPGPQGPSNHGMPLLQIQLTVHLKEPPPAGGIMINLSSDPSGISPSAFRATNQIQPWPIAIANHAFSGHGPIHVTVSASSGSTKARKEITVQGG